MLLNHTEFVKRYREEPTESTKREIFNTIMEKVLEEIDSSVNRALRGGNITWRSFVHKFAEGSIKGNEFEERVSLIFPTLYKFDNWKLYDMLRRWQEDIKRVGEKEEEQ